jgi:hypothetical protein
VLSAAAVAATLMFVSNTQILPKANGRLASLSAGSPLRNVRDG